MTLTLNIYSVSNKKYALFSTKTMFVNALE